MLALAEAYPRRIAEVARSDDDIRLRIGSSWFYWADSRMLPESERATPEDFTPFRFYDSYRRGPLVIQPVDDELADRLRERSEATEVTSRPRHPAFTDALYGIQSRRDADKLMRSVLFLDMAVWIHPLAHEPLLRVERDILELTRTDAELRRFVDGLRQLGGYYWRNIANTRSRSYHSYGVAIDIIPSNYGGRFAYWQWANDAGVDEWWSLTIDQRWVVPQQMIDAFERHGFVWGGKWLFYDPIHFEYRPETLILADWRVGR